MDVRGVQRIPVLEVPVQRRARTSCRPCDLVHPDGRDIAPGEQLLGSVEDSVGGHLGAPLGQPVARHYATVNGTDSGLRT